MPKLLLSVVFSISFALGLLTDSHFPYVPFPYFAHKMSECFVQRTNPELKDIPFPIMYDKE